MACVLSEPDLRLWAFLTHSLEEAAGSRFSGRLRTQRDYTQAPAAAFSNEKVSLIELTCNFMRGSDGLGASGQTLFSLDKCRKTKRRERISGVREGARRVCGEMLGCRVSPRPAILSRRPPPDVALGSADLFLWEGGI